MNFDKIAEDRLFANNTKEEITYWCKNLSFFKYLRARGGHNCEGDSFCVYFKYTSKDDLVEKMFQIGVLLEVLSDDFISFDPFESYDLEDLDKLKITISSFPDLIQPQYVEIFNSKVHIWVLDDKFEISVSGSKDDLMYKVSDADFVVCRKIENELNRLHWQSILDNDIENYPHCISQKIYPELF